MPKLSAPVRSFFYLALLGALLITIAMVVRSGILARKNPGRPINSTMRAAMNENAPQLSTTDALLIAETYGTAKNFSPASAIFSANWAPATPLRDLAGK